MTRIEFYVSKTNRDILKNMANTIGESTIHDDFIDIVGNPTKGNTGRLTFGIKPDPIITPDQITVRALVAKIENNQSLSNLEERDFRKLYHVREIR